MSNRRLIEVIGLLLIVLVMVVGYKLSPMLLPVSDVTVNPDPGCDVQRQSCAVVLPSGQTLTLTLSPQPVPLARPFQVAARVSGGEVRTIEIDFAGVDMSMGYNRVNLVAGPNGQFSASATLPVCVTGRMIWLATVVVDTGRQRIAVPFRFVTGE